MYSVLGLFGHPVEEQAKKLLEDSCVEEDFRAIELNNEFEQ